MGQEAACEVRFRDRVSAGKAQLETDEIVFRGDFRLKIPLQSVQSAEAVDGALQVCWAEGAAVFALGPQAEKWAHKIHNQRTLADKLDVKPGSRVALCGVKDAAFRAEVDARTGDIAEGTPAKDSDLVFLAAEAVKDLARLKALQTPLKRNGAIWAIYPKGRKDITEHDVRSAGLQAGLVDVKVARFSETHTALKFVIPVAKR